MLLLLNLKTYRQGTAEKAEKIAATANEIAAQTQHEIAVAPQPIDILRLTKYKEIKKYTQHIDPVEHGSNTGHIQAETARKAGIDGTLLNHSEKRLKLADIDKATKKAQQTGLEVVICANNPRQTEAAAQLNPEYVAVEPPELIGTGTPVSKADPDIITDAADKLRDTESKLLCGAGITNGEDVEAALELGANGVLVASGVVKHDDPATAIKDLLP